MSRSFVSLPASARPLFIFGAIVLLAIFGFTSQPGNPTFEQAVNAAGTSLSDASAVIPDAAVRSEQVKSRPYVGADNGKAFWFSEDTGVKTELRTSRPVFKAFAITSDRHRLLYSPLNRGIPSGELYLEDLSSGTAKKITTKLVLDADLSPTDDALVAFTFAGPNSFGLAVANIETGRVQTIVSGNVYSEIIRWNESGSGIYYFESSTREPKIDLASQYDNEKPFNNFVGWDRLDTGTAAQDEEMVLTQRFAAVAQGISEDENNAAPSDFPVLKENISGSKRVDSSDPTTADAIAETYSFSASSPNGKYEITGNDLLGTGRLVARSQATGEQLLFDNSQLVKVLDSGIVLKEYSGQSIALKFVDWRGKNIILAVTTVGFNLPVKNSTMIQGGVGYPSPGNCNISAHSGQLEFAYDFQNTTVGAHVLASADGLVVFNLSSVTCNSVQTSCPDYVASGCPGSFLGNVVVIQHADGTFSKYAHMQTNSPQAEVGTSVNQGLYIGRQGHTGSTSGTFNSCGDHVHFQRQSSPDIYGQSIAIDFADVAVEPLSCGTAYTSASNEIAAYDIPQLAKLRHKRWLFQRYRDLYGRDLGGNK